MGILVDDEDEVSFANISGVVCPLPAFRQRWKILGSLSNDDGDGNDNAAKQ